MLVARPWALGLSLARSMVPAGSSALVARVGLVLGLLAPLSVVLVPPAAFWERAHISIVAYLGLIATIWSWRSATGRVRSVRGWIGAGFALWTLLHLLKNIEYQVALPVSPDLLLVVLTIAAAGAVRADLVGRMPWREELAVYLDAAVVTVTASATMVSWLASAHMDPNVTDALLYASVFVGILGATLILDLAVLAELKPRGAYVLLAGLGAVAAAYVVRAVSSVGMPEYALAGWLSTAGVLLVAYGTATWNDVVDDRPRYVAVAALVRRIAPLAAVVLTPLLLVQSPGRMSDLSMLAVQGLAAFALIGVVARQSLLLQEREGMLGGLTEARRAAERRTQQIAGLEEVGRLLAASGPTESVLSKVVEVIHERFGYAQVAVYLYDEPLLRLGAQRGYPELFTTLDGERGIVGRVMRRHEAALVPDVLADPDYLMADPQIRSEICAPLLDGGEFLGVLDVESATVNGLDETDLAAVVAVADRLAGAMALALRRQRLLIERNFTSTLLDTVAAAIVVTNSDGRVVRFNPACAEITGYSIDELRQHGSFEFLVPPEARPAVASIVGEVQNAGVARSGENEWLRKDGSRRRISWTNRPLLDADGSVAFVLATGIDITERKQLEDQLAHRALHDPLTALPNRALLMDRLEHALKRRRSRSLVGVLFVDLDAFKLVNDTLGHEAGDLVLIRVARQLSAALRPEDTCGRVGGDEFAAVLEGLRDHAEALTIAERVREAVNAVRIDVRGVPVTVKASIGVAVSATGGRDAGELLRYADIAMYSAKAAGGARTALFRDSMYDSLVEQRDGERLLAAAIADEQFVLHYQPIVRLRGGQLVGAEALVRWQHPTRGLIYPAEFLSLAESTGQIVPIGAHVMHEACAQMATWIEQHGSRAPEWISVNVSPRQFTDPRFVEHVDRALQDSGLAPARLMIEITETLMLEMGDTTTSTLDSLRARGIRFAIDDFGSGYSGLSYLRRLPIELIKIDRSFISGIDVEPKQLAFVSALIAMGETLGLKVLAEGIETAAQHAAVRRAACELGQGHHIGWPVEGDRLVRPARAIRRPAA